MNVQLPPGHSELSFEAIACVAILAQIYSKLFVFISSTHKVYGSQSCSTESWRRCSFHWFRSTSEVASAEVTQSLVALRADVDAAVAAWMPSQIASVTTDVAAVPIPSPATPESAVPESPSILAGAHSTSVPSADWYATCPPPKPSGAPDSDRPAVRLRSSSKKVTSPRPPLSCI